MISCSGRTKPPRHGRSFAPTNFAIRRQFQGVPHRWEVVLQSMFQNGVNQISRLRLSAKYIPTRDNAQLSPTV